MTEKNVIHKERILLIYRIKNTHTCIIRVIMTLGILEVIDGPYKNQGKLSVRLVSLGLGC